MPLLNTEVWVEDNKVRYEHYRKPSSNPLLMLEMSAMPANVKRSVLTQEVVTTMKNISPALPWSVSVKHLNRFSERMKASGYDERYRFQIIKSGVEGYEKMKQVEESGGRPINTPRSWEEDLRQKKKHIQKKGWFRKGGYDVPLFVPHTPRGELAKKMRSKEAENNQGRRIRFKIVEKGGVTLEQKLRRSNPWSGEKCQRPNCFPCKSEKGGNCWRESVTYDIFCKECGRKVCAYKGETGRNAFTRGGEHLEKWAARDENNSVLWIHAVHHHQGREEEVEFEMRVTGNYNDPLDRQIMESVQISTFPGPVLMNRRSEMGGVRVERMQHRRVWWGAN